MSEVADVRVRPARPADAASIAVVQERSWRAGYAALLGPESLADLDPAAIEQAWEHTIGHPPSARHRVLVAMEGPDVAGFAAYSPAGDEDADPQTDAELVALHVDPARTHRGHGSRLTAAAVDLLREDGFTRALAWVFAADDELRAFLRGSGWEPDGATRDLEAGRLVHQIRLHAAIPDAPAQVLSP